MGKSTEKTNRKIFRLFIILLVLGVNVKSIFTDYGLDNAYALATSWRFINGDTMFGTMAEPHMTSSFIAGLWMRFFFFLTKSTTGMALSCQIFGALLILCVSYVLYVFLKRRYSSDIAFWCASFFAILRPKHTVFPEFSNLLVIFSALIWLFLSEYFRCEEEKKYLILASVFSCCLVLSYPPTAIVCAGIFIISLFYCSKKKSFVLTYVGTCFAGALLFICYLGMSNGFKGLWEDILFVLNSDSAHGNGILNFSSLVKMDLSYGFFCLYPLLMIVAFFLVKRAEKNIARDFLLGVLISVLSFASVMLVTNLTVTSSLGYMLLGGMVSVLLIQTVLLKKDIHFLFSLLLCLICAIFRVLVVVGFPGVTYIYQVENYVREGPNKGIVTTLNNCNRCKEDYFEWNRFVGEQDIVLAVGGWYIDSSVYLTTKADIGHFSTMCNPTYNENLLKYWEKYPSKVPSVIAVEEYDNNTMLYKNSWLNEYIDENYTLLCGERWSFFTLK